MTQPNEVERISAEQLEQLQRANDALNVAGEDFAVAEAAFLLAQSTKARIVARAAREHKLRAGDLIKDDGAIVRKAQSESAPSDETPTAGAVGSE